jgi:signal transduction histidine kinase
MSLMVKKALNLIVIEDDPDDVMLVKEMCGEAVSHGVSFSLQVAGDLARGLELLRAHPFDLILLDLGLPDSRGLSSINELQAHNASVPIVVMTGQNDELTGLEAVKMGAQDYVVKGSLNSSLLLRVIRYAIERHQLRFELMSKIAELENFANYLTHNIKNNLLVIKRITDLAEVDPTFIIKNSKMLSGTADSLIVYINKLLQIARAGKIIPAKSEISLVPAVSALFEKMRPQDVEAELSFQESFPHVDGDRGCIEQLFITLLGNSVRYRDPLKSRLQIHMGYMRRDESIDIIYGDNGSGIEAEKLERLFDNWYTSHDEHNLGIGLAMAKKIMEAHGGTIAAKSEGVGRGFEIILRFPCSRGEPQIPERDEDALSLSGIQDRV